MQKSDIRKKDKPFFIWLYGFTAILSLFYLFFYYDLLIELLINDVSYISLIILLIFSLSTIFLGYQSYQIQECMSNFTRIKYSSISKNMASKKSLCNYYDQCMYEFFNLSLGSTKTNIDNINELLEVKLYKYIRTINFVADLLIRLGLIGTVIGFIIMLQSVTLIENFDITLMQDLMRDMSGGMMVALYTTLTGITSAVILMLQNKYLEQKIIDLYSGIIEVSLSKNETAE